MYKDCGGIAVVKIAVNNDLKHYSLIIRNTKAYKTTKNIAILMGALFLINSAGLVIDTARTHRPQPFLILLVSAFFLLFAAYMIRLLVKMDPMKLHKKVEEPPREGGFVVHLVQGGDLLVEFFLQGD
jgi:hypothetical protein